MAEAAHPLIQLEISDASVHPTSRLHKSWSITETGQRVLAGAEDFVRLNGIDLWLGGVQLRKGNLWRWNEHALIRTTE